MLELDPITGLPNVRTMAVLLSTRPDASLPRYIDSALLQPAQMLTARAGKKIRAHLVSLGARLYHRGELHVDEQQLTLCAQAIELLHTGSLIIDDIQDNSPTRRGDVAVHAKYGTPAALCAGNWLYFWPLRLISELKLPITQEHQAFALYHNAVELAHYGQALDLSVRAIDVAQADVPALALAILELKTGAITALALTLGATASATPAKHLDAIARFGYKFGVALQQFDDFGNLLGTVDGAKRYEDMIQLKMTAVWQFAAMWSDAATYATFVAAAKDIVGGKPSSMTHWLATTNFVQRVQQQINTDLKDAIDALMGAMDLDSNSDLVQEIIALKERLTHAYI